jgi:hypothetical protein
MVSCAECQREVSMTTGYRSVSGYEPIRGRKAGGTNHIVLRKPGNDYLCADCAYTISRGGHPGQGTLA